MEVPVPDWIEEEAPETFDPLVGRLIWFIDLIGWLVDWLIGLID